MIHHTLSLDLNFILLLIFTQLGEGVLNSSSLRLAATDRIRMGKLRSDEYAGFWGFLARGCKFENCDRL